MATFKTLPLSISDDAKPQRQRGMATLKGQVLTYLYPLPLKIKGEKEPADVRRLSTFLCMPQDTGEAFVLS